MLGGKLGDRPDIDLLGGRLDVGPLGIGLLGGRPGCRLGCGRRDYRLLGFCLLVDRPSIGPLIGRLSVGKLGGRRGDWQPPSSCNPHLSVPSNDFAGFALFNGG